MFVTFSTILGKGPPPPSPFPNTSKDMSEDSKFWEQFHERRYDDQSNSGHFVIGNAFVYVSNSCLGGVGIHYENISDMWDHGMNVRSRTGSHVAKNLSTVNAYPVESAMRKDVAIKVNVNERHEMK